jgi:hypothetical protein
VGRRAHRWGVPRWNRATRGTWLREPGRVIRVESDQATEAVGSFLVPLQTPDGRPAVLTRTLLHSAAGGNGWSTTYTPE